MVLLILSYQLVSLEPQRNSLGLLTILVYLCLARLFQLSDTNNLFFHFYL